MFFQHSGLWLPATCRAKPWRPSPQSPVHVIDGFVWNPWRERFEDVRGASYIEILAALHINHLIGFGSGANFTPITNTYNSGTGATETAPTDSSLCTVTSDGGGGGGSRSAGGPYGGGGSGRCVTPSLNVSSGGQLTYTVGAAGAGRTGSAGNGTSGGATTTSGGTGGFSGVAHNAGGGGGATTLTIGSGGSASGGTTNTAGQNGASGLDAGSPAGDSAGGGAGGTNTTSGGASPTAGSAPGGGGGGGDDGSSHNGANGAAGRISFAYT